MKKIIKSVMLSLASLFIMFGCSNQASDSTDNPSSTTIENLDPSTLSENGKYFTVEGATDGIKITLKDDLKIFIQALTQATRRKTAKSRLQLQKSLIGRVIPHIFKRF